MILSAMPSLRVLRKLVTAAMFSTVNGVSSDAKNTASAWSFELLYLTNPSHPKYQPRATRADSLIYMTRMRIISTLEDLLLSFIAGKQSETVSKSK